MATPDFYYYGMGKSITFNGSTLFTAYGADLSPQHPTFSGSWNQLKATGERDFNCSGFQVGNSVLAYTWTYVSWEVAGSATIDMYLFTLGGTRLAYERHISTGSLVANGVARYYTEIAIMDGQIRDYADDYRLYFQSTHSAGYSTTKFLDFSVSSMYADTEEYEPGVFTVRGTDLVYTDYGGYSHHIQYDGNYSGGYVGTSNSGKIWVQNGVARRLYYVDQNGYVRRTYEADNRYGSTSGQGVNVGSQYAGALRTGGAGASGASGRYLCFVNPSGYKMRIMNGNPNDF